MEWYVKTFQELANDELYELMQKRIEVFVVEQECPYPELDGYDRHAMHLFLKVNEEIAAIVRILPAGVKYDAPSIGRVLVVEKFRGNGYAQQIMRRAIEYIAAEWDEKTIQLQGQVYLKKFYSELGFKQVSESYLEDGIPHIDMIWERK